MGFGDLVSSYKQRLSNDGLSIRDEYINSIKDSFLDSFDSNVNYKEIQYKHNNDLIYITIPVHFLQFKSITNANEKISLDDFKRIVFKDLDFIAETGDLVKYNDEYWIVVSTNVIDFIHDCTIQKSNNTLKFYDENSILYEIPCIVGDKVQIKTEENKYITTVSNEIYLTISHTEITEQIKVNEIYKIGLHSYQIESVSDDISIKGLLVYKLRYSEVEQQFPTYSINILNGTSIRADKNNTLQLQIQVSATINNITTVVSPTPALIFNSSNDSICTVDSNGLCTFYLESSPSWDLTTIIDEEMILDLDETYELTDDGKFLLNDLFGSEAVPGVVVSVKLASDESIIKFMNIDVYDVPMDNLTVLIDGSGSNSIIKNYTDDYSCVFKNNSIVYSDVSIFYLTGDDGISVTNLAQITVQDGIANTCTVKGLGLGYVKLFVKNVDETVISGWFRIKIESLF